MSNIKKSLTNYVLDKGSMPEIDELLDYKDVNECLDIIFSIINDEIEKQMGDTSLGKSRNLIKTIAVIINNSDGVDRKLVKRKIHKLDSKISHLRIENKNKFHDIQKAYTEFEKTSKLLEKLDKILEEKNTQQYDFLCYIIDETKEMAYVEYTFLKMPNLVNTKDRNGDTLYYNMIKRYMEGVVSDNREDYLYYGNILVLIANKKNFNFSEKEKKKCLELIYKQIDKLSVTKKKQKQNKEKIEILNDLSNNIKQENNDQIKINKIAGKYNISVFFNEELIKQAKLVKLPKEGDMTNRIIIDDYTITIDKEQVIEIDDALSCKKLPNNNYQLIVQIPSVLGYFSYDSDIVQEALNRNHSIYLSQKYQEVEDDFKRTIPIFPYGFSAKNGSLIPGEKRLTRSYIFEISPSGEIVSERFVKSISKSNRRTTYREINNILLNGSEDKQLEETVRNLYEVANILEKRDKVTELYELIKENTEDSSDLRVKRVGSEKIVYQAMLLTGNRVAEYFANNNYPCLYRVHKINNENAKKIQAMIENLEKTYGGEQYKKLYQLIEGIYPKGWYAPSGSHDGLGLDHYCHITSELRRAADIVVEHALEICYDKEPTQKELVELELEVKKQANQINEKTKPIDWFVKEYKRSNQRRR